MITDPGCERTGEKKVSCTHCDYETTETIAALGHDYEGTTWTDECGTNCNHAQDGNHVKQCKRSDELCTDPHNSQTAPHTYPTIAADAGWADYTGTGHGLTFNSETQKVQKREHQCDDCTHVWYEFRVVDLEVPPSPGTYTVVVNYVDGEGNVLKQAYTETINVGTGYDVSEQKDATIEKDDVAYSLSNGDEVTMSGGSAAKDATVTITLVYAADAVNTDPVEATYTVRWLDAETGEEIRPDDDARTGNVGDTVSATDADKAIEGYTYVSERSTASNELAETGTVLILYFTRNTDPVTYTLTVRHVYYNAYGSVVSDTSTTAEKRYAEGEDYATSANSAEGYRVTVSGTPNGKFPAGNVTVTYTYRPTVTPPSTPEPSEPVVTPTPSPEPSEEVEVTDPPTPLDPTPELPEEPIEVDEPDTPLVNLPELPEEPVEVEVEDPDVPLANVPQTGDNTVLWATTAVVSGAGLIWLAVGGKKKEQED